MTGQRNFAEARRRLSRAYRVLRCPHTGGLVYEARCRINDRRFVFSRCDCGYVFTWHEVTKPAPFEREISGALKSCIDAHGPITKQWIASAAKRIGSAISK